MKGIIALNFKAYHESTGERGLSLIKTASALSKKTGDKIILCPETVDLHYAKKYSSDNLWFFAQHSDANEPGAHTGSVTLEAIAAQGCKGTLLNHSEKKIPTDHVRGALAKAGQMGLKTIVCADTVDKGVLFAELSPKPWAIAVEPPELIGSGVSVSRAQPLVVENAVCKIKAVSKNLVVLVGAGVSNAEDYRKCLELGANGVLLASAFVKAQNPRAWLASLL
ncbi:TPA: triose-phosphate isomerase [Candidatus Micrarchaeota archaeon]|nr:triose-phosphate isomerase [Candidatus Micrarchaeota archaeon]